MANKVDALFASVLALLPRMPEDAVAPDQKWDDGPFDEPFDDEQDYVDTLGNIEVAEGVAGRLEARPDNTSLAGDEEEAAEAGVRHSGFEVLAFYKSRRHIHRPPYKGKWGIFYLRQGLTFVALHIARAHPGYGVPTKLALEFLRSHEWFHFRADLQTLMLEAATKRHLSGPARQQFRGRRNHFVEEALANRQAWDWAKRPNVGLGDFAFDFMKVQPDAYARFDENRLQLAGEWAANVVDLNIHSSARRVDLAHWVEVSPEGLTRKSMCPEYVVTPARLDAWWPAVRVPPPVQKIIDDAAVTKVFSKSKDTSLAEKWGVTKDKLLTDRFALGLDFKPWPKEAPAWSVRVDKGFRAHLNHEGQGLWRAYKIGPHDVMGHG